MLILETLCDVLYECRPMLNSTVKLYYLMLPLVLTLNRCTGVIVSSDGVDVV